MSVLDPSTSILPGSGDSAAIAERGLLPTLELKPRLGHVRWLESRARALVHSRLGLLRRGRLTMVEQGREQVFDPGGAGNAGDQGELDVRVVIRDPGTYAAMAFGGTVGGAEAYIAGLWECEDLTGLGRLMLQNRLALEGLDGGLARFSWPLRKLLNLGTRNTRAGALKNIQSHYDLGNEFFEKMLDPTMMYSSAIFPTAEATLHEASVHKLEVVCRKLNLQPDEHLIEIGTGWGGLAMHAAQRFGCRVMTTTISRRQFDLATARVRAAGLSDRITVVMQDYRDLQGQFDKLVSIEMVEAVGREYHDTFFATCARLLKPEGRALIQAITIDDRAYDRASRRVDFLKQYIFPGSCLLSMASIAASIKRASDFRVMHMEDIGPHYVRTLQCWRENFERHLGSIRGMGVSPEFVRLWQYYLAYCEAAFAERYSGDVQVVLAKPGHRERVHQGSPL
jgi:cyclopropane-fatty-acyl-phospholipid synthase